MSLSQQSPPASPSGLMESNVCNLPEGVLPFVRKAYEILSDANVGHIIAWSPSGASFVVHDTTEFSDRVLPRYFKHRNFCSFVRQLNTYGFAKADTKTWEFQHELFRRDAPDALLLIKRRKPAKRAPGSDESPRASPGTRAGSPDLVSTSGLPSSVGPDTALLMEEVSRLRAAHESAAAVAKAQALELAAVRAQSQAVSNQLRRYQDLCTDIVSQVSANQITFPTPSVEKDFLSSLCTVLLADETSGTRPASPVADGAAYASPSPPRAASPASPSGFVPSSPATVRSDVGYFDAFGTGEPAAVAAAAAAAAATGMFGVEAPPSPLASPVGLSAAMDSDDELPESLDDGMYKFLLSNDLLGSLSSSGAPGSASAW